MYSSQEDTIAAIATPPGEGGVAIVRISGSAALAIADKIFSKSVLELTSHTVHYGKIINPAGKTIDHAILIPMHAPRSYTGETTVEIQCHGGSLISKLILETVIQAGARLSQPGEFTMRAYLNGKIDLPQAEAVQQLIAAKNDLALKNASAHLEGKLSKQISLFQKELTEIAAILEAWVDFPEEGLEFASHSELLERLGIVVESMQTLLSSFHKGKKIHEGLTLCLLGRPNVGKSSLLNQLLGKERAIVTPIAGTTRDLIEADLNLGSYHFKIFDTAGIRDSDHLIEQEGISRSHKAAEESDIILYLIDASVGISPNDQDLLKTLPSEKTIVIWNKIDLCSPPDGALAISAKQGQNIDHLEAKIEAMLATDTPSKEEVLLTSYRHKQALSESVSYCQQIITGLQNDTSPEFLANDIRSSLIALARILGTDVTEDILSSIFSNFCVGK